MSTWFKNLGDICAPGSDAKCIVSTRNNAGGEGSCCAKVAKTYSNVTRIDVDIKCMGKVAIAAMEADDRITNGDV